MDVLNFSEEKRELYEDHLKWLRIEANTLKKTAQQAKEEGIAEGIDIGEARGIEKGAASKAIEIATRMLEEKVPIELISSVTGLNINEVLKLQNKMQ